MISFESDYIAGAHPAILKNLAETNMEALPGYGTDRYSERAKEKIKRAIGREDLDVEFLVGGTQTNSVIISSMLRDFEGVVAAETGHISVHEAGAVEYSGNKVLTVREKDGKILPEVLRTYLEGFYADGNHEHMVFPGMVYISHPTEYGTLYKKSELSELSGICREYGIPLFLDGARLGYGLMSRETDVTLADIAEYCDVFYIGGTKVGALCGEAVVFTKGNKPAHFMNSVKKRGALLAKGRLLGVQFDTLFTDDLYFEISRHAIEMTEKMKDILKAHGLHFYIASPTNQQFVVLEDSLLKKLTVVRFAASWSTTDEDLRKLDAILDSILEEDKK